MVCLKTILTQTLKWSITVWTKQNKILFKQTTIHIMKYITFQHLMTSLYSWIKYQGNKTFEMQHNVNMEYK